MIRKTKVLNTFFSNIIQNLDNPNYTPYDCFCAKISGLVLKVVVKHQKHQVSSNVTIK